MAKLAPAGVLRPLLLAAALTAFLPAAANEFWITAHPYSPAIDAPVEIGLRSGEFFSGARLPFSAVHAAALQLYSKAAVRDLRTEIPVDSGLEQLTLVFANPGTHMVVYDSEPGLNLFSPDSFHAYLQHEGLEDIIRLRAESGMMGMPVRERFRRHAKALLRVGGKSDGTYGLLTGQRLEIVPAGDPLAKSAGDTLAFTLFFDSKPLGGALVKAWHKRDGQTTVIRARTAEDGKVALSLPYGGVWMVGSMHMVSAVAGGDADWESFWGSLTFELGQSSRDKGK